MIQNDKKCYICYQPYSLHIHHIFFGKDRKKADKYGLTCYLCYAHHLGTNGVHGTNGKDLNNMLKKDAQKYFEKYQGTREEFMAIFHKNYLWSENEKYNNNK